MPHLPQFQCTGCAACASICPTCAIRMCPDDEGFLRPVINEATFTECGQCETRCPVISEVHASIGNTNPAVDAAWHQSPAIRNASTSGGVFSALAMEILGRGGVVFGTAFDDTFNVRHLSVETAEGLASLRGSKYVQSRIEGTFEQARDCLEDGRPVLFSGTSCQVAGLQAFLVKEYKNLFTVDLICHGVPSPRLWRSYLDMLERHYQSRVVDVVFRDKRAGWTSPTMVVGFASGKKWIGPVIDNVFYCGFARNLILRPSCYSCPFKRLPYPADVTLGDFWSIELIHSDLDRTAGVSMILVNSTRGAALLRAASSSLFLRESNLDFAIRHSNLLRSKSSPPNREGFLRGCGEMPFEQFSKN